MGEQNTNNNSKPSNNNKNNKNINYNKDISNTIEMLNYYQNEFMYRHTHYWHITIKLFLLTIVVSLLPLSTTILGIELKDISNKNILLCFPILGFIISLLSFLIIREESKRMNAVNKAKYRINRTLPSKYQYEFYENKQSKKWMARIVSQSCFIAEILIIACITLFIIFFY